MALLDTPVCCTRSARGWETKGIACLRDVGGVTRPVGAGLGNEGVRNKAGRKVTLLRERRNVKLWLGVKGFVAGNWIRSGFGE